MFMKARRSLRRLLLLLAGSLALASLITFLTLPYDSSIILGVRFQATKVVNGALALNPYKDDWASQPPQYPVSVQKDVGILIKTGYGTRHRIPAQIEAMSWLRRMEDDPVVAGDWAGEIESVLVHDAVGDVIGLEGLEGPAENSAMAKKYQKLREAVENGTEEAAQNIGEEVGWELDVAKFAWGLGHLRATQPGKKWYLIVDDDTFVIRRTLAGLLGHLDPSRPHYIGNPVGDFKARFAHGGSAIIVSAAAVTALLARPDVVLDAHRQAVEGETWGDKLVATTLQKVGVYLDERFAHLFNGETPRMTKLAADRFCAPLLGFHGATHGTEMRDLGRTFDDEGKGVVSWGDVWKLYGGPGVAGLEEMPVRHDWDYVGRPDEHTRSFEDVATAEVCRERCESLESGCLAWAWVERDHVCRASRWVVVGKRSDGTRSGVNVDEFTKMAAACPKVLK